VGLGQDKNNIEVTFNPTPINTKTPGKLAKSVERNSVNTTSVLKMGYRESANSSVLVGDAPSIQYSQIKEMVQASSKKRGGIPQKSTIVMMAHTGDPLANKSR
jgi:hypothetical protein